ncbi:MAG TPA: TadE family protein [Beijerinckiaceae bacterium]|jgi:Flp pilus assembly protein TadG
MRRVSATVRLRPLARFADESGVAVIEAALSFPFLVILMAGLFEFGLVFYNFQLVQTGVRDAGRYLSRVDDIAAATESAKRLAVTGSVATGQPARVKWWNTGQVQVATRTVANPRDATTGLRNYRAGDTLTVVRVSTAIPYEGIGLLAAIGLGPIQINAAHEERYVGN